MKLFQLVRKVDISGVSGTGVVAEGVEFHDGQCAITWFGKVHSVNIYSSLEDLIKVHGHEGNTEVVFIGEVESRPIESQIGCNGQIEK